MQVVLSAGIEADAGLINAVRDGISWEGVDYGLAGGRWFGEGLEGGDGKKTGSGGYTGVRGEKEQKRKKKRKKKKLRDIEAV